MKIALFTETYTPDVNGVVSHVKTLKDGLESLGHEVLIVFADKHCKHHYIHDGVLHCPSVAIKRFYGFGAAFPYSRKRLRLISDFDPDVIHIHHEFGIGLSGIMYAKLNKKPLVYTLHTMYDQYMYYIAPRPLIGAATKISHRYERFIARNATMLTGPSQKCGEYFRRIGVQKEVNLIPNSADLKAFDYTVITHDQKSALRDRLGIHRDVMVTCFAGRIGKEKSVDVLIDYWARTVRPEDKMHLLIMGGGPELENLKKLAATLGIADMITFAGMIKHDDMPVYYAICDAFASASLSEMNSVSMLESMACGLVVLQRYDELNADQIKSGVNGYLFHTPEEFAAKLREIRALTVDELLEVKAKVRTSMVDRGSSALARYMLGIYDRASAVYQKAYERERKDA